MTRLSESIRQARSFATKGDDDGAESALREAVPSIAADATSEDLLEFADLCRVHGPLEGEELALRSALARSPQLELTERLLSLLQGKLNVANSPSRIADIQSCEALGTQALVMLGEVPGLRWANFIGPRGLRRMELVQLGRSEHADGARADLNEYRAWLERDETVPSHLQRRTLLALADVDLAELDLSLEMHGAARSRLESAISELVELRVPKWMLDRANDLLRRSLAELLLKGKP